MAKIDARWVRTRRSGADLYKGIVVKKPQTWSLQGKASGEEMAGRSVDRHFLTEPDLTMLNGWDALIHYPFGGDWVWISGNWAFHSACAP